MNIIEKKQLSDTNFSELTGTYLVKDEDKVVAVLLNIKYYNYILGLLNNIKSVLDKSKSK